MQIIPQNTKVKQESAIKGGFFWSNNIKIRFQIINRPAPNIKTITECTGIVLFPYRTDLSVNKTGGI